MTGRSRVAVSMVCYLYVICVRARKKQQNKDTIRKEEAE
jgi:hypothetical protein